MAKTTDPTEISNRLVQIKQATENGYYAPVESIELKNGDGETLDITLDYPDNGSEVFSVTVPDYWESDRMLPQVLNWLDVSVSDVSELNNRSVPIKRTDGTWEVDMTRLQESDYIVGNSYTQE